MKILIACAFLGAASPAFAALKIGDKAPDFTIPATLGGKEFSFHLADALKSGPVVVYFYPAAFTKGCTIEAHDFATAMPQYKALGASVRPASLGAAASRRFAKRIPRTRPPPMTPAAIPAARKVRRSKPAGD